MSDVFISYAREDREWARALAACLEAEGWSVWWDLRLAAGRHYDTEIRRGFERARRLVVLWSIVSDESDWGYDEAARAKSSGRLVPYRIESDVESPMGFRRNHVGDLFDWDYSCDHERFLELRGAAKEVILLHESTDGAECQEPKSNAGAGAVSAETAALSKAQAEGWAERAGDASSDVPKRSSIEGDEDDATRLNGAIVGRPRSKWILYLVAVGLVALIVFGTGPMHDWFSFGGRALDGSGPAEGGGPTKDEPTKDEPEPGRGSQQEAWSLEFAEAGTPVNGSVPRDQLLFGPSISGENSRGLFQLVPIPSGEFEMGSDDDDSDAQGDEKPVRTVLITRDFWMSATEITWKQWDAFETEYKGSDSSSDWSIPVTIVSWEDTQAYLKRLNEALSEAQTDDSVEPAIRDYVFRLPTEAEWEYACRAGTTGPYSCAAEDLADYAWFGETGSSPHPVASKAANPWGLYDMHGNVWEWCRDWYAIDYYRGRPNPDEDPLGPEGGSNRVIRGGGWRSGAKYCRSASRDRFLPDDRYGNVYVGFRVVLAPPLRNEATSGLSPDKSKTP